MKIEKITTEKQEWAIVLGPHIIPVSLISALFRPLLIVAILLAAYTMGQADSIVRKCNEKIMEANRELLKCNKPQINTFNLTQVSNANESKFDFEIEKG